MSTATKTNGIRIRRMTVREHGCTYQTFQLVGYVGGERIRKRFTLREDALAEKNVLEVRAANGGDVQAVNTRLSRGQLAEAEAAFHRLGGKSLSEAVDWYLSTYKPPCIAMPVSEALAAFLTAKQGGVEAVYLRELRRNVRLLEEWFPGAVRDITGADLEARMQLRGWAAKTWNNVRGSFHGFFDFCAHDRRRWTACNPVGEIPVKKVARGLPHIESAARIAELFEFLERDTGGPRRPHQRGALVPYFALATFAGIRPAIPGGELWKMGRSADLGAMVDTAIGVIRLPPTITKTDSVRQIKMRNNLSAWLERYPLKKYPLILPNMAALVTAVRSRFGLAHDVLRHTWISMHVAAFKSLGEAALEAGNSETIIRRHYLNMVSEAEAAAFWSIVPRS